MINRTYDTETISNRDPDMYSDTHSLANLDIHNPIEV